MFWSVASQEHDEENENEDDYDVLQVRDSRTAGIMIVRGLLRDRRDSGIAGIMVVRGILLRRRDSAR